MRIGFHASHEQWAPNILLEQVLRAEQAGFTAAMCSDHFHPWLPEAGESGFSWSWLGAALQASNLSFGTVCAPGQRYHPAIIAQAAATLAILFPGRFWLSVGSGEALNESITGARWPAKPQRNARLRECVDIMRALWAGETVTHRGLVDVVDAKLYSRPVEPPMVIGAAISAETARWCGSWADGLITVGKEATDIRRVLDAFREGGGEGKPVFLQSAISFAASEHEALMTAHREWRHCALSSEQCAEIATPAAFAMATREITPGEVQTCLRVSADIGRHIDWLYQDQELGIDAVYLHQVGRDVEGYFTSFAAQVLPLFA